MGILAPGTRTQTTAGERVPQGGPKRLLVRLWLPALVLVCWQIAAGTGILDPLFFPPPSDLARALVRYLERGELVAPVACTLRRMIIGFGIGAGAGLLAGLLMGTVSFVRRSLESSVSAFFTTPKISLLPMLMLLLGVNDSARVLLVALGVFLIVALHSMDAVRGIHRGYIDLARNYGASPAMVFRTVYVPAALPSLFTGIRIGAGRALVITVAVELISCPDGIGNMIWMSWQTLATEKLYIGILLTALIGALAHSSLRWIERRCTPWQQG